MSFYVKDAQGRFLCFSVGAIDAEAGWTTKETDAWRGERWRADANARDVNGTVVPVTENTCDSGGEK